MDGDIFAATCQVGGLLGNVYDDCKGFAAASSWQTCEINYCSCGADLFIPKAKTTEVRPLLRRTQGLPSEPRQSAVLANEMLATERTHFATHKQVYWEIGRRCNFDCSYCADYIHNKTERHRTLDELKTATNHLLSRFSPGSLVNFIISGGEPTLNPDFMPWARWISENGHYLSMHSNGSRLPEYYRELVRYGDLNLSVHFEFTKIEKMLTNIAAITDEKVQAEGLHRGHLEVKIMMPPGFRQQTLDLEAKLREIPHFTGYCTWAIVPVRGGIDLNQLVQGYEPQDHALFGDRR